MTGDQRADIVHFAEALERATGLHVDAEDCRTLAPALRALLKDADGAESEAWETVAGLAATLERAVANGDGVGIFKGRCMPMAAAIRVLLDSEANRHRADAAKGER
jgi:hypothetical protein